MGCSRTSSGRQRRGVEGGVKVQGVFLPSYITSQESNTLSTKLDQAILIAYAKSITDKINADATAIKGVPNPNSYSITKTDFTSKTSSGLGDNNESDLESSNESRDRVLTSAGKHLRTIEIIIGEFSGLGLCDIVAITGALKILPLGNLYGLLDDDAYNRMKTALPTALDKRETFIDSISKLSENVEAYYNLMDSQYKFTKEKSKSK